MKISTKGRYALRMMLDLAVHQDEGYVSLKEIAERQGISKKYLEAIVKILVKGRLVKGTSGKGGGYRLMRTPEVYTIGEILELTEGTLATVACLHANADQCPMESSCKTLPMWKKFDAMVHDYFFRITLADLVNGSLHI